MAAPSTAEQMAALRSKFIQHGHELIEKAKGDLPDLTPREIRLFRLMHDLFDHMTMTPQEYAARTGQ